VRDKTRGVPSPQNATPLVYLENGRVCAFCMYCNRSAAPLQLIWGPVSKVWTGTAPIRAKWRRSRSDLMKER